jgi:hypothetical protein
MARFTAEQFINPQHTEAAINLYNDIRTSLEDAGWEVSKTNPTSTYWWTHPSHGGTFSMAAAFRQLSIASRLVKET